MFLRTIFLVFCTLGILSSSAHAQFYLEQAKVSIPASGGDHIDGSLVIHNQSADPADIKVYWEDFKYKAPYDGTKEFLPAGTAPGSANRWVVFSPQSFTMTGFGQQKIDYTITIPPQLQEGHYGVLFFEKSGVNATINGDSVSVVTRIGCLFFIEPKDKDKKAVLQDIELKDKNISASFVNQGNVILTPHTTYYIMQDGGLVLLRGDAKKAYVPPGASAPIKISLKKPLDPGKYTLVLNSDLEEGDVVVKEVGLTVDASGQIVIGSSQD